MARWPAFVDTEVEHLGPNQYEASERKVILSYLSTNDLPLVLLPVLVGKFESLHVLVFPDAKFLAQSLVPHLQCCNLKGFASLSLEAGGNVLPGKVLIFLELD